MKTSKLLPILTLLFGVSLVFQANGQITTSSLKGMVTDQNSQPLPGANVIAVHIPTGVQYGISTRTDGRFNLPNLKPGGPYTVTTSFVGYNDQVQENVYLSLGQALALDFELAESAQTLEELVITAEDNIFNSERTGPSENFNNDFLKKLPTISRSASDIYRLTPSSDGNSFGGRNDQYNNFSLDGSIFNNPFGLDAATPGGQTNAQPISLDAIDQIQVGLAPFDVTQSGFTGASVNAITKSGTNEVSGTAFFFFRNQGMTGSKVDGQDIVVPDLQQLQAGFSIGGPIIKNKLFFFANLEVERREDAGSNFVANSGISGENVSRVLASDLMEVSRVLDSAYQYQTGAYENYLHDTDNQKGILKIDWNINQSHSLTFTYNFLDATKGNPAHPAAIIPRGPDLVTLQFENSGYAINNKIHSGIVELKSLFGNEYSNNLQVGYTSFRDTRDPFSTPFPVINILQGGAPYIIAGHEPFSVHNELDQNVFQLTNNFTMYKGRHTITVGTSFERFAFRNSFNLFGYGSPFVFYGSAAEFIEHARGNTTAVTDFAADVGFARRTVPEDEWANVEPRMGQWALYLQDEIAVNDKLNLTIGLRTDLPLWFDSDEKAQEVIDNPGSVYLSFIQYSDELGNRDSVEHTQMPDQKLLFSPRLGFNYDIKGDQSAQLRGGIGLFTGRFPFVWVGNHIANPSFFFYNYTATDFKYPQVMRASLGFDKRFGDGWTATADFMYTKDVNAMMVRKTSLAPPTGTLAGVDNRRIYQGNDFVSPPGTAAWFFTNTSQGRAVNLTFQLQRNWSNGLYASLAYNLLDSKDASSIEAEITSDAFDRNPALNNVNGAVLGPSIYGNKHRIVGSLNRKFDYADKFATTISFFFEYAQGGRFSYTYSGDINGDGSPLNDLLYIPTDTEIDAMNFTGTPTDVTNQRSALKAFIAQDDYMSENRGQYAEKYDILSPWYSRWDMRVLQDFQINTGNMIQLSFDILNVGNLISGGAWGVRERPVTTQPLGVSVNPATSTPTYTFNTGLTETFANDFSLNSRWQLQIGLRYIFN